MSRSLCIIISIVRTDNFYYSVINWFHPFTILIVCIHVFLYVDMTVSSLTHYRSSENLFTLPLPWFSRKPPAALLCAINLTQNHVFTGLWMFVMPYADTWLEFLYKFYLIYANFMVCLFIIDLVGGGGGRVVIVIDPLKYIYQIYIKCNL